MQRKLMFMLVGLVVLSLLLAPIGSAQAQDPRPPQPLTIPSAVPYHPMQAGWMQNEDLQKGLHPFSSQTGQNNVESLVNLGQPGLSFRYVQTFGTTMESYFADTTHLNRPVGLFMDGSNNLYVTEDYGDRVLKYDSAGNNLFALGQAAVGCYAENYIFCYPKDAALDGSGDLWVADGNRVVEYDSSGNFIQQFPASEPWMSGDDNAHFNWIEGIAFDNLGHMFVSDTNNQRVQVFTFTSDSPVYNATIGVTGVSGNDSSHFNNPYRLAVDSSNRLYVADQGNNRVQRCTFSGTWACVTFNGGLNGPQGITIDGSNNVYIADTYNGNIVKCSSAAVCTTLVPGTYGFYDLAVDSSGNVYGSATYEGIIVKYNSGGGLVGTFLGTEFVPYLTDGYHYLQPRVAIDGQNNIIIVEEQGQRLTKLASNGTFLWSVGVPGVDAQDNDHFMYPHGVATDANGNIYVADNNRVQIFNSSGTYQHTIGGSWGSGNYQFQWASGIAVDNNGTIYVSDCPNQRVQVYNSSRIYVATIGETDVPGSDNSHLNCPIGVDVDAARNIYVSDAGNNRVQKFNSSRVWQMTLGTPGPWGSGSDDFAHFGSGPEDIAVDAQGRIYVADGNNNRVQVFDSNGAYLTTIGGSWGANSSQFRYTSGVDVDSQGNVYVADFNNARIQKFAPGVPGWQQANINGFGRLSFPGAFSLAVFNNQLYAGANNWGGEGASIYRTNDGSSWSPVMTGGFGQGGVNPAVIGMIVFNNKLYAGTGWGTSPGQLWRSADGTTWNQITGNGMGVTTGAIGSFAVYGNALYAGMCQYNGYTGGSQIWRSTTGDSGTWSPVVTSGLTTSNNGCVTGLKEFNGYLYAGVENQVSGAQVWRSATGNLGSWTQVNTSGFGAPATDLVSGLAVFNGYLYVGTRGWDGRSELWRSDNGTTWNPVNTDGFGDWHNWKVESLFVFNGALYAGVNNNETGVEVWRSSNGATWTQVNPDGFGDSNNESTLWSNETTVFNNSMYIGVFNYGNGVEIWKMLPIFADVSNTHWAWGFIERLYNAGITGGCSSSPLMYCPGTVVTRDQMAVFLLKAKHGSSYVPPAASGVFADVPTNYWAAAWIEQLAAEGVTGGCNTNPLRYCPGTAVTRDQMAVFLVKNFNLP